MWGFHQSLGFVTIKKHVFSGQSNTKKLDSIHRELADFELCLTVLVPF